MKTWGFYGRSEELETVQKVLRTRRWFFCAVQGRRRIGKTTLLNQAISLARDNGLIDGIVYAQIPDSDERDVVGVFKRALLASNVAERERLAASVRGFADMAQAIYELCRTGNVVVLDEFQYFTRQALKAFSSLLQYQVDRLTGSERGGVFVLGSIQAEMTSLLEGSGSPLHGRLTHRIDLGHWDFETLLQVFREQGVESPNQWLTLWTLFEGVPKFYRDTNTQGVFDLAPDEDFTTNLIVRMFIEGASPLAEEADTWFLRELRGRGVSLLRLLADRRACSHSEIVAAYEDAEEESRQLGAYLERLTERYRLVDKQLPVFADSGNRVARYVIADNFLQAWLAVIEPIRQASKFSPIAEALSRHMPHLRTLEGFTFERLIRQLHEEAARKGRTDFRLSDQVRGYWNRPRDVAKLVEIDLVAWDEEREVVRFGSCKRSCAAHTGAALGGFREHIDSFLKTKTGRRFASWDKEYALFSPKFQPDKRKELATKGYVCRDLSDYAAMLAGR